LREVTRQEFREVYFRLGGGEATGWGLEYWNRFFEPGVPDMKYLVDEPETPAHSRMMIVTDHGRKEHRLFFLTEEAEERFFDSGAGADKE